MCTIKIRHFKGHILTFFVYFFADKHANKNSQKLRGIVIEGIVLGSTQNNREGEESW